MTDTTEAYGWQGRNLLDSQGEKVGKIHQIYEDQRTGKPEWALVTPGCSGPSRTSSPWWDPRPPART